MGTTGPALTSDRSLRLTSYLLCGACLTSVFRNLHLGTPSIENVDNALLPRSFNCRLMELTSILGFLASRAELQELYAGGYNARRRGFLSLAFLLQALCMTIFDCNSTASFLLAIGLLVGQLGALLCAYRDIDFGPGFLSPWVIRAAAGAGIAWACVALCLQVQRLADRLEMALLSPSAVVITFSSAMGLAVCLRYDWMLAAALAFALWGMTHTASERGDEQAARLCRRGAALSASGAVLALRCAFNRQQRFQRGERADSERRWKRMDSSVEDDFQNETVRAHRQVAGPGCKHLETHECHIVAVMAVSQEPAQTEEVRVSFLDQIRALSQKERRKGLGLWAGCSWKAPHEGILQHQIPILDTAKFAAIVGIGPKFGYNSAQKTLLMNYHVDEFSICLNKESGRNGYLTWGPDADDGMDPADVATARVLGKHHWATNLTHVSFTKDGNSTKSSVCQNGCAAIVDSGTSLIAAPASALMELGRQIGKIEEDCSNLHELPNLKLNLDGHDLELPPQAYVMRVVGASVEADSIWDLLFFKPKIRKVDSCMPAFMEMDMNTQLGPVWILGMPFFRYYHTTFNRERQVMRFAKAGEDCEPKSLRARDDGDKVFFAASGASDAAYRPLDVNLKSVLPPRFSLQYGADKKSDLEL
ncbi:Ctsd [Symbiodinium pilosum]|uniref:Ctsd protein n=1 Tax=Symbiodinium pilosum TaxID=2952 RepID=A0A812XW02_SYMPI|nr:Ctsd [Symbiodinium pilosum]